MPQCHFVYLSTFTVHMVYPEDIAAEIEKPDFPNLIQHFIHKEQHSDDTSDDSSDSESALPTFYGKITVFPSAVATFHAPSDISGIGGMCCEQIRAVKVWRKGPAHYDTIFVNTDPSKEGMRGLEITHVQLFFSFSHDGVDYPSASGNLQISVALLALFRAFLLLEKRKVQKGEKLLALFALFALFVFIFIYIYLRASQTSVTHWSQMSHTVFVTLEKA